MTGKNYQFHKKWNVDLNQSTAFHESGLIVQFEQHFDAKIVSTNQQEWRSTLSLSPVDLAAHEAKLIKEAKKVWEFVSGKCVADYLKLCTSGIIPTKTIWKIKIREPRNAIEKIALDLFLGEIEQSTGTKPSIENWH